MYEATRGNKQRQYEWHSMYASLPPIPAPKPSTMPFPFSFSTSLFPSRTSACDRLFNSHLIMILDLKLASWLDLERSHTVAGPNTEEVAAASKEAFKRYSSPNLKQNGIRIAIIWLGNDFWVWVASDYVLCGPSQFWNYPVFGVSKN